jgi:O-antigen/teichoic acid export membrane protein
VKYIFIGLFPLTVLLIALAPEGLSVWLGKDFAVNSAPVARWLLAAVFINGLAQVPFAHLQSEGRPDLTAKLHLIELPFYVGLLFPIALRYGIRGVAITWFLRVAADTVLMFFFSQRYLPESRPVLRRLMLITAAAIAVFALAAWGMPVVFKTVFALTVCLLSVIAAWVWIISPREKKALQALLRRQESAEF